MKLVLHTPNKYALSLFLIILMTFTGGEFFGSFQPPRLLLIGCIILYFNGITRSKINIIKEKPIVIGTILFIFWIIYGYISLIWSPAIEEGLSSELIVMNIGFLALPVFFYLAKKLKDPLQVFRRAWLFSLLITTAMAAYEFLTWNHFPSADSEQILGGINIEVPFAAATFGNINNFGAFIVLTFPYLLWSIIDDSNIKYKVICSIAIILGLLIVTINGSRMGMFIGIFQILCFLLQAMRKAKKRYILLGLVLILIFISFLPIDEILLTMKYRLDGAFGEGDESTAERMAMIKSGFEMLIQSGGIGIGAGGFESAVVTQKAYLGNIINPHNLFVEIFAQYGIMTIVLFCYWLLSIFFTALKNKDLTKGAKMAVCISIFCVPFIGTMQSATLGYTYWWLFLCSSAIIASYHPLTKNKEILKPL